ncbi:hypothetical protein BKA56DRAFT_10212 [Ilyonectria sp. MPI-CAGE-AT-0026]|nr:hypothetical protein BKA56DRAFT_10212 [Ilyonectria sp. MPI-CAGE-AT-0026]
MTSFPPPSLCEAGSWGGADTYVGSGRGIEMCELEVGSLESGDTRRNRGREHNMRGGTWRRPGVTSRIRQCPIPSQRGGVARRHIRGREKKCRGHGDGRSRRCPRND